MEQISFIGTPDGLMEYLYRIEIKCEGCGKGLDRIIKYGRNICDYCEEKLLG